MRRPAASAMRAASARNSSAPNAQRPSIGLDAEKSQSIAIAAGPARRSQSVQTKRRRLVISAKGVSSARRSAEIKILERRLHGGGQATNSAAAPSRRTAPRVGGASASCSFILPMEQN